MRSRIPCVLKGEAFGALPVIYDDMYNDPIHGMKWPDCDLRNNVVQSRYNVDKSKVCQLLIPCAPCGARNYGILDGDLYGVSMLSDVC